MKILCVHNRYKMRGGEDVVFEQEVASLREHGHDVVLYEDHNSRIDSMKGLAILCKTLWSFESYRAISRLIELNRPDIMHVHNFFPLVSPSIYYAAWRKHVPVIQTLHNYRLVCANAQLLRNNRVCEDCLSKAIPWPGGWHACYRNNRFASGGVMLMLTIHRLIGTWRNRVDKYIALTEFARQKFIESGMPESKIIVRSNFVSISRVQKKAPRSGAVFVGMLHPWKGADVLINAWNMGDWSERLTIVGDGPEGDNLKQMASPSIQFAGRLNKDKIREIVAMSKFLIFPSIWYETFGLAIIEAFACGTPVIASRLGSAAELVRDGENGLLFEAGNVQDLTDKILWALSNPLEMEEMGRRAYREYDKRYSPDAGYRSLVALYKQVLEESRI